METERSFLPYLQEPATGPYPDPDGSTPYYLCYMYFNIIPYLPEVISNAFYMPRQFKPARIRHSNNIP